MIIKDKNVLRPLRKLLKGVSRSLPENLQNVAEKAVENVWEGIDCLSCANCCKTMTPTYTNTDIKRIAAYLKIPADEMKRRWLRKERGENKWANKRKPCQFLDLGTNLCNVYKVRPADCAGFPHLAKKNFINYIHVHRQNLDECPATFKMIERMNELADQLIVN